MEATSPPSSPSPSLSDLPTAAHPDPSPRQAPLTLDDDDDDDFEFALLLPLSPRPAGPRTAAAAGHPPAAKAPRLRAHGNAQPSSTRTRDADSVAGARRRPAQAAAYRRLRRPPERWLRWYELAFGSVRVPAAMDMAEIKNRLGRRRPEVAEGERWAPWKLIRWLSCQGVESAAVAVAAAPVRLL